MDGRVIIYARVSTDDQAEHGVSLEAQVKQGRQYAELYDLEVVDVVTDPGASAKNLRRPGWCRVARMLDAGEADGVVIAKLDRMTRSLRDLDSLLTRYFNANVTLHCIAERVDTSTASGRLCLNMLMSVAQWEREVIAERTSAALQHKRAKGETYRGIGTAPFGYQTADDGVSLVEDLAEQAVIREVQKLRELGVSIRQIAERLNEDGAPVRGQKWHPTTVARLLKREAA